MNNSKRASQEQVTLPCDQRYRNSKYFLEDQLRCSETVADFKSVKDLVNRAPSFCLNNTFQFQPQAVAVPVQVEP
jgi:hypothetical protein